MPQVYTAHSITRENHRYADTNGVSKGCARANFLPAFRDRVTGEVQLSRFADGSTAPIHLLDGLPAHWVVKRDRRHRVVHIKGSVEAGFVRSGEFFTREQVFKMPLDS